MFIQKKRERKRDEKMACQRSMTQTKRERKDGMPKKHDPAIKSDMKTSMYLSVH